MNLNVYRSPGTQKLILTGGVLELSGLAGESVIQFVPGGNSLVAIPAQMTAIEVVGVIRDLQPVIDGMYNILSQLCGCCTDPDGPCRDLSELPSIPAADLERAGIRIGPGLTAYRDEGGGICVEEADAHSLRDVPEFIQKELCLGDICLGELDDAIRDGDIVYDVTEREEDCLCSNCRR